VRAVRLEAVGDLRIREVADRMPGPREVLLRVEACGVCGTDRHILHGDYPATLPVTLGHELAGSVVAAGVDAHVSEGTRVAVDPNISCGRCRECRRGNVALCPNRVALGVDLDGGLADYALAPLTQVYPLPSGVPAAYGALCGPRACCWRGLDLAGIQPGMSVAVLGGGVIGQLMVQLVRLAGAATIVLATRQAGRRSLAERLGATATVDPRSDDMVQAIAGMGGIASGGVDVALECVGSAETFEQAVAMVRRGGTVLVFGVAPQTDTARISPFDIFARELRILGSYLNPLTHGRAVELVASGLLTLDPVITHPMTLDEIPATLAAPPLPGEVKAMLMV